MTRRIIQVVLDPSGVRSGAKQVENSLDGVKRKTNQNRDAMGRFTKSGSRGLGSLRTSVRGLETGFSGLSRIVGPLVAAFGVRELIQTADAYNQIQGSLRLVTEGSENLLAVQSALFDVAQETRQPLAATVDLYTRLARTTNFSEKELVDLNKTIGQTIALSQAAPASAQAALFQLGQGFAAGALRGEELNSVLEQTPELAKAIADGLGVSTGELRKLGEQGKLTAEAVQGALANVADRVESDFAKLPLTVGQSITKLQNSFTVFVGEVNSGVGVTAVLADAISNLADFIANDLIDSFERFGSQIQVAFIDPIQRTRDIFAEEIAAIGNDGQSLGSFLLDALSNIPINIATIVRLATVEVASFIDRVGTRFQQFQNFTEKVVAAITRNEDAFRAAFSAGADLEAQLERQGQARIDSIDAILRERSAQIEAIELQVQERAARREVVGALSDQRRESSSAASSLEQLNAITEINTDAIKALKRELDPAAQALRDTGVSVEFLQQQLAAIESGGLDELNLTRAMQEAKLVIAEAGDATSVTVDELAALIVKERELSDAVNDAVRDLEGQNDTLTDFLKRARENAQDILSGFLADPLADGLDQLPAKFANVLQQLAAEALASEIFQLLGGLGGGDGGFFGNIFGALFGGGRMFGGSVRPGQPVVVGERGRPEVFVPSTAGRIIPNERTSGIGNIQSPMPNIIVRPVAVVDDKRSLDVLASAQGEQIVMTHVRRNESRTRNSLR